MLLLNSVNGDTTSASVRGQGTEKQIIIWADDFGGGNVALFTSADQINWVPLQYNFADAVFTANISFTAPKISSFAYIQAVYTTGAEMAPMIEYNVNVWWG
jgi:hypothetical protein